MSHRWLSVLKDPAAAESTIESPANGLVTYTFPVVGGSYAIAACVITSGDNESFWLRIPGIATQTNIRVVMFNGTVLLRKMDVIGRKYGVLMTVSMQ